MGDNNKRAVGKPQSFFDLKPILSCLLSDFGSKHEISDVYKCETFGIPLCVWRWRKSEIHIGAKLLIPPWWCAGAEIRTRIKCNRFGSPP